MYGDLNRILKIIYPTGKNIRSRRIISRSRSVPTGKYPSWKLGRMVYWESKHERDAFKLLDASPLVLSYMEQPLQIRYLMDGIEYVHYPDMLVHYSAYKELWEVKPNEDSLDDELIVRTRLLTELLPAFGFRYRLIYGSDLMRIPRLSNVNTLLRFGRPEVTEVQRELVRNVLTSVSSIPWGTASQGELGPNGCAILARLFLEGYLTFNVDSVDIRDARFSRNTGMVVGD